MAAPASYGWNLALIEPVPHAGTCEVPAHDINDNVDQQSAEVAVDGDVIPEDEFDIAFDIANQKVTVTNLTGETWDEQSNVYVSAQRTPILGSGAIEGNEARIATLEGQVADLSTQLDDHEARLSALEAAP
jgi:hypothetical protein